jgi:hypothetical protein
MAAPPQAAAALLSLVLAAGGARAESAPAAVGDWLSVKAAQAAGGSLRADSVEPAEDREPSLRGPLSSRSDRSPSS